MNPTPLNPLEVFSGIPAGLRAELLEAYNNILTNYLQQHWEASELNGGKLCEVAYTVIRGNVDGKFPSASVKPSNMVDACRALEQAPSTFPRSVRIQIPRMIIALYEIRNNRGVGHLGGDVNPSHMDATAVLYMSKWIMAEMIRLFHGTDSITATSAVDLIVERVTPTIWAVDGKYRILDTSLKAKEKTLLVLYHVRKEVSEPELIGWVEHSNPTVFRNNILKWGHKEKLLEYDSVNKTVRISPKGIDYVQRKIPLEIVQS